MGEECMNIESTLNIDKIEEGDVLNIRIVNKCVMGENLTRDGNDLVMITRKGLFLNYVPLVKVNKQNNRVMIDFNNEKYYPVYELEMLIDKHLFLKNLNKKFCNIGRDKLDIVKKDRLEYFGLL